ncbi:glycoside hydrolase family 95-like protein [Pseudoduganella sp. S-14]|jgi:hypothetical protein|uniref:glycoside hydrolase family 95-like protein n=1 Tax=Pseudoduganella sp. S-14 TaxID=3404065 RepID=UPI003CEF54E4
MVSLGMAAVFPVLAGAAVSATARGKREDLELFDGNFGGAAGIIEIVLKSWGEEIHVLAALPKAWPEGGSYGIHARGAWRCAARRAKASACATVANGVP